MFSLLKTYFPIKTSYHKKLLSSSLVSKLDEIMLDDILFLMSCFENTNIAFSQNTPQHHMEEYFSIALEHNHFQSYQVRQKVLLVVHLMLHEFQIGLDFASIFLLQKFTLLEQYQKLEKTPLAQQDSTLWLTINIQLPYYQYLQRLALNVQVFHACKIQQYPRIGVQETSLDVQTKMFWLFKISNLVTNGLGQVDGLKVGLVQYPKELLLKEMVLVYWSDMIVFYNFLSKEVLSLLDYYRQLPPALSLQFYELYLQLFTVRNNISDLYKFREHFDVDKVIQEPQMFQIKKAVHKDIEDFMIYQRLEHASSARRKNHTERPNTRMAHTLNQESQPDRIREAQTSRPKYFRYDVQEVPTTQDNKRRGSHGNGNKMISLKPL